MRFLRLLLLLVIGCCVTAGRARGGDEPPATQPAVVRNVEDLLAESGVQSVADPRVRRYVIPSRIVWTSPPDQCSVEDSQVLLQRGTAQVTLSNHVACTLRSAAKSAGIVLDFGRELQDGSSFSATGIARPAISIT
jgi:hypothetical protein